MKKPDPAAAATPSDSSRISRTRVKVAGKNGLCLHPAEQVAQVARLFDANILLQGRGCEADAKSVLSIVSLEAARGAQLRVTARGGDARAAVKAVAALFAARRTGPDLAAMPILR